MDEIRFNQSPREMPTAPVVPKGVSSKIKINFNSKKILKYFAMIVVLVVVVFAIFLNRSFLLRIFQNKNQVYSAVFLSNGQVYFGKMVENGQSEMVLNNVFYVQLNDKNQVGGSSATLNQTSFNLVKLGNELHGPTDELFINKVQVVFYEKLRDDSKVVESIKNYKVQ